MKRVLVFSFLGFLLLAPAKAQRGEKPVVTVSQESGLSIYQKGISIQLQDAPVGEKLEILNIVGVRVFQKRIENANQEFLVDIPKGYYIVKIGDIVRKISIK